MVGYESTSLGAVTVPALGEWLLCHILLCVSQDTDPRPFKGYSAGELRPTGMNKGRSTQKSASGLNAVRDSCRFV